MSETDHPNMKLTEAQAEMYDRQLRVWGVSTQLKIARSRALVIGPSPTNFECAKNVVLAGVSKVVLCGGKEKEEEQEKMNFLVSLEDSAKKLTVVEAAAKSLQEMNPFGEVSAASFKIEDLGDESIAGSIIGNNYDVVICC